MPTFEEYAATLAAAGTVNVATDKVIIFQSGAAKACNPDDLSSGGGAATVTAKTADFTANGTTGTVYAVDATSGPVVCTLSDAAVGTSYTVVVQLQDNTIVVRPATGQTIIYNNFSNGGETATDEQGINLPQIASFVTVLKIASAVWAVVASSVIEPETL